MRRIRAILQKLAIESLQMFLANFRCAFHQHLEVAGCSFLTGCPRNAQLGKQAASLNRSSTPSIDDILKLFALVLEMQGKKEKPKLHKYVQLQSALSLAATRSSSTAPRPGHGLLCTSKGHQKSHAFIELFASHMETIWQFGPRDLMGQEPRLCWMPLPSWNLYTSTLWSTYSRLSACQTWFGVGLCVPSVQRCSKTPHIRVRLARIQVRISSSSASSSFSCWRVYRYVGKTGINFTPAEKKCILYVYIYI